MFAKESFPDGELVGMNSLMLAAGAARCPRRWWYTVLVGAVGERLGCGV
jgi:hypothetical protein